MPDLLVTLAYFSFQFPPCLYRVGDYVGLTHALKMKDESSRVENTAKLNAFCFTAIQTPVTVLRKLCRYLTAVATIIIHRHTHVQQVTSPGIGLILFILF